MGIMLLNTAVIYLTYLLARRTIGAAGALWAALFTATLPWVVYYSVGVYNPEVMSFLSALLFLALWQVTRVDRSASIFWLPLLLLATPQFHMSGLALIPAVLLVLWLSGARLSVSWLLGGLVAGLALYLPYVRGEVMHGWQNTRGMFGGAAASRWNSLKALAAPLSFLVNWAPEWTHGRADYQKLGQACFGSFGLFLGINLLSVVVAVFLVLGASSELRRAMHGFWAAPRAGFRSGAGHPVPGHVVSGAAAGGGGERQTFPYSLRDRAAARHAASGGGCGPANGGFSARQPRLPVRLCHDLLRQPLADSGDVPLPEPPDWNRASPDPRVFANWKLFTKPLRPMLAPTHSCELTLLPACGIARFLEATRHEAVLVIVVRIRERENGQSSARLGAWFTVSVGRTKPDRTTQCRPYHGNGIALMALPSAQ